MKVIWGGCNIFSISTVPFYNKPYLEVLKGSSFLCDSESTMDRQIVGKSLLEKLCLGDPNLLMNSCY